MLLSVNYYKFVIYIRDDPQNHVFGEGAKGGDKKVSLEIEGKVWEEVRVEIGDTWFLQQKSEKVLKTYIFFYFLVKTSINPMVLLTFWPTSDENWRQPLTKPILLEKVRKTTEKNKKKKHNFSDIIGKKQKKQKKKNKKKH